MTLTARASVQALSEPLEAVKLERLLEAGRWEGSAGHEPNQEPFKLSVVRRGRGLVGIVAIRKSRWSAPIAVESDGTFKLTRVFNEGTYTEESETITGAIRVDLATLDGSYVHTVRQGFTRGHDGKVFSLTNKNVTTSPNR